jgi:hypothetical protein
VKEKEKRKKKKKKGGLDVWKLGLTLMRGRAVAGSPELASSARTWLRPGFASLFELIIVITKTSHPIFVMVANDLA